MAPDQLPPHLQSGKAAEDAALNFLSNQGLQLNTRNYRCSMGEIDLIMQEDKTLVFIEVRYRQNQNHGSGAESVTAAKQKRIIRTASYYLQSLKREPPPCRFDVISASNKNGRLHLDWIKRAFEL